MYYVCAKQRSWWDFVFAQAHLSLHCSLITFLPCCDSNVISTVFFPTNTAQQKKCLIFEITLKSDSVLLYLLIHLLARGGGSGLWRFQAYFFTSLHQHQTHWQSWWEKPERRQEAHSPSVSRLSLSSRLQILGMSILDNLTLYRVKRRLKGLHYFA